MGNGGNSPSASGNAGGNAVFTNVGTANGGGGGTSGTGNAGTTPGAALGTISIRTFQLGTSFGNGGSGGYPEVSTGNPGNAGAIAVFENIGT